MELKDLNVLKIRKIKDAEKGKPAFEVIVKETETSQFGEETVLLEKSYKIKSMVELDLGRHLLQVSVYDFTDAKTGKRIAGSKIIKIYETQD